MLTSTPCVVSRSVGFGGGFADSKSQYVYPFWGKAVMGDAHGSKYRCHRVSTSENSTDLSFGRRPPGPNPMSFQMYLLYNIENISIYNIENISILVEIARRL